MLRTPNTSPRKRGPDFFRGSRFHEIGKIFRKFQKALVISTKFRCISWISDLQQILVHYYFCSKSTRKANDFERVLADIGERYWKKLASIQRRTSLLKFNIPNESKVELWTYLGSTAALRTMMRFPFPWSLLARIGLWVPVIIRDCAYRLIARNRYYLFGQKEYCGRPSPTLKAAMVH